VSGRPSLDDYVDVSERIALFKEKYPDGSLQSEWRQEVIGERVFIVCEAHAYRTPDDERPGHGIAWEPFPGPTPYTRDSELMNAQTSAWGRAIVAIGLTANRKIASRQEVQARSVKGPALATPEDVAAMRAAAKDLSGPQVQRALTSCHVGGVSSYTQIERSKVAAVVKALSEVKRAG